MEIAFELFLDFFFRFSKLNEIIVVFTIVLRSRFYYRIGNSQIVHCSRTCDWNRICFEFFCSIYSLSSCILIRLWHWSSYARETFQSDQVLRNVFIFCSFLFSRFANERTIFQPRRARFRLKSSYKLSCILKRAEIRSMTSIQKVVLSAVNCEQVQKIQTTFNFFLLPLPSQMIHLSLNTIAILLTTSGEAPRGRNETLRLRGRSEYRKISKWPWFLSASNTSHDNSKKT